MRDFVLMLMQPDVAAPVFGGIVLIILIGLIRRYRCSACRQFWTLQRIEVRRKVLDQANIFSAMLVEETTRCRSCGAQKTTSHVDTCWP